jgi:DNA-directed RNA polymerase subunit RPC12/RpoP
MQDILDGAETKRTDLTCTECGKMFIAQLDMQIDGNHIIECPHCGHEHCRVVKKGKVTDDRWDSRGQRIDVEKRHVWKATLLPMSTSTAAEYIRQKWINFGVGA